MSTEWKSINKIMVEIALPETTARRYLATFNEFFTVKQFNKIKKYRDDAGHILLRIAELYEQKKSTGEIRSILKNERADERPSQTRKPKQSVRKVEAELQSPPDVSASVSIETLSQQNLLIMATLKELAAGIKQINNQRDEIAQLKREIQELRLQLVSISQGAPYVSTASNWHAVAPLEMGVQKQTEPILLADDVVAEAEATSEHIDEVVPNEPVVLPSGVNRQQLADIIAELRAHEPKAEERASATPASTPATASDSQFKPEETNHTDQEMVHLLEVIANADNELNTPPLDSESAANKVTHEETSILLDKSYVPPEHADDSSHLSRVNSRSHQRNNVESRKWWQFWR